MPKPELYVIYTGDRKSCPEYITLKDEFFGGQEVAVDAKVKVIYDGKPGDIINQYVIFTQVCNEQVKLYGRTQKAIEETIRICKDKNVLKEYLESREKEVINIMVALYDEQEVMDRYVTNKVNVAVRNAVSDAKTENARGIAKKLIALGALSYEDIASSTGLSVSDIEELANLPS